MFFLYKNKKLINNNLKLTKILNLGLDMDFYIYIVSKGTTINKKKYK